LGASSWAVSFVNAMRISFVNVRRIAYPLPLGTVKTPNRIN